jgi:hypothetical protein
MPTLIIIMIENKAILIENNPILTGRKTILRGRTAILRGRKTLQTRNNTIDNYKDNNPEEVSVKQQLKFPNFN